MRRSSVLLAVVVWAACARPPTPSAPATPPGPTELRPTGTYFHPATRLEFPETIGVFTRDKIVRWDAEGFDSSGHYTTPKTLLITATVYHYPANATATPPTREEFERHFAEVVGAVMNGSEGGEVLSTEGVKFEINSLSLEGAHAVASFDVFHDYHAPVRSHLYLFALDGWYLKFRFTHPVDIDETAIAYERSLIESTKWPLPDGDVGR